MAEVTPGVLAYPGPRGIGGAAIIGAAWEDEPAAPAGEQQAADSAAVARQEESAT